MNFTNKGNVNQIKKQFVRIIVLFDDDLIKKTNVVLTSHLRDDGED